MRAITGKAKGRKLMMVPGAGTCPITDRAKECFSVSWATGSRRRACFDLFGGTGGVGIESLSRGAVRGSILSTLATRPSKRSVPTCGTAASSAKPV